MHIKKFNFQKYRSFNEAQEFHPNPDLNIIIGENNTGKSNIFKVLKDLIDPFNNYINTEGNLFFGGMECEEMSYSITLPLSSNIYEQFKENYLAGNYQLDHFEFLFSRDIVIEIYPSNDQLIREISIGQVIIQKNEYRHGSSSPNNLITPKSKLSQEWIHFASNQNQDYINYTQNFINKIKEKIRAVQQEILFFIKQFEVSVLNFSDIRQRPNKPTVDTIHKGDFSPSGSQIGDILFRLQNSPNLMDREKFTKIEEAFHNLFQRYKLMVSKIENLVEIQVVFQDIGTKDNPFIQPIISLGIGVIEMLIFLVNLIAQKDKIFILEEPELHLHPNNQLKLLHLINQYKSTNQIFIITHSSYFICSEDITSNILVRMNNGASQIIQPISQNALPLFSRQELSKFQRELEYENFENLNIFFARAVLLVEGPTEKGGIPILANALDKSFFQNNIYIAKVNGKTNFRLYYNLLSAFQIPCLILADKDAESDLIKIPPVDKFILSSDFEGVISNAGYGSYFTQAKTKYFGKPLRTKWVLNQIIQKGAPIPKEFEVLIDKIHQKI